MVGVERRQRRQSACASCLQPPTAVVAARARRHRQPHADAGHRRGQRERRVERQRALVRQSRQRQSQRRAGRQAGPAGDEERLAAERRLPHAGRLRAFDGEAAQPLHADAT